MDILEDMDYYCVDNMPAQLVPTFLELIEKSGHKKVAMAADVRSINSPHEFASVAASLQATGVTYKIIFLECADAELVKRYQLSRRRHPLMHQSENNIADAIERERALLAPLRERADYIIDTTFSKPQQLKQRLLDLLNEEHTEGMKIYCMSFGFKYGSPSEADLMFDVRCLPNPYYVEELKEKTGQNAAVQDYVMHSNNSKILLEKFTDLTEYLIPLYEAEGKSQLVIAFGCSGGHHRSVTFAEKLAQNLKAKGLSPIITHRDIEKG